MLKIPKGLKKKKKGKKSKRKGEEELFTEEELEKYRQEKQQHQQQQAGEASGEASKENEEWSKFKDLTTGVDSILKKTQGDLDRIKSTSFFQRIPAGVKQVDSSGKEVSKKGDQAWVDFEEQKAQEVIELQKRVTDQEEGDYEDKSEFAVTDTESDEEDGDDIFDTSYVEAVERGEVKLAYVPDSPEEFDVDDDIFDTSYADKVIKGQEIKPSKGKKTIDIGVAVEVLTGRIDNLTTTAIKRPKRAIPGDLLLGSTEEISTSPLPVKLFESTEKSLLDTDSEILITTPIDLSVSLHTVLLQQQKQQEEENQKTRDEGKGIPDVVEEFDVLNEDEDEFTRLAAESLENTNLSEVIKFSEHSIVVEPVLQDSWSTFEESKKEISIEVTSSFNSDQVSVEEDLEFENSGPDPFDTSFADTILPVCSLLKSKDVVTQYDDDFDFDPRVGEIDSTNNRRKSTVHIHLTDPTGFKESITSDDIVEHVELTLSHRDLLGGSSTDLTQLNETPLAPVDLIESDINFSDPFDTTIIDSISAPGKFELKFLEEELIGDIRVTRSPSDPDFDPRADEIILPSQRKASRPENLFVNKTVLFDVKKGSDSIGLENCKGKSGKPLTPYYSKDVSITEDDDDVLEAEESKDTFGVIRQLNFIPHSHSDHDLPNAQNNLKYLEKRRYSEFSASQPIKFDANKTKIDLLETDKTIETKVLTPGEVQEKENEFVDPFDTSIVSNIEPSKTELKLLANEFSFDSDTTVGSFACNSHSQLETDLLAPADDIFQIKALTPEDSGNLFTDTEDIDPFDTSFAGNLQPGKTELKLLESEFLNN